MLARTLGGTGISVSPIGYGTVKIGRNQKTKYGDFLIPTDAEAKNLLLGILDLGINLIDTAPAYGLSETRIGNILADHRKRFILSTKVGETFVDGKSYYDFGVSAIENSVGESLRRLRTDYVDILLVHSNGQDREILDQSDVIETLQRLRSKGWARAIGFSGSNIQAERTCLDWADIMMIEYHAENTTRGELIDRAQAAGVGVLVKKGLDSGRLSPTESVGCVLAKPAVSSMVIGGLNLAHFAQNCALATQQSHTEKRKK